MTSTLLNLAGKIDRQTVTAIKAVCSAINKLNIPYVIVGATARDLVLHYGHGAKIERATHDIDFAIEVPNWAAFDTLKETLCEQGFKTNKAHHRLISPSGTVIDILPFGGIADRKASLIWPPAGDVTMSVLGFQEACDTAQRVRIQDKPQFDIPVATPIGMVLLKFIAWTDRPQDLRKKDALDIAYLLSTYEAIQKVTDTLYNDNNTKIMEKYGWDITQSAAYLMGQHARNIAHANTRNEISKLVKMGQGQLNIEHLAEEMCEHIDIQYEKNKQLLTAFMEGFTE